MLKRRFEVPLAVLDLPREHGLSDLEKAGRLIRHDQICVDVCVLTLPGRWVSQADLRHTMEIG